jgi:hypothetical protein
VKKQLQRFFAEIILSVMQRFFALLRMTSERAQNDAVRDGSEGSHSQCLPDCGLFDAERTHGQSQID